MKRLLIALSLVLLISTVFVACDSGDSIDSGKSPETRAGTDAATEAPEETTAAPEETTQAPEDITVPEETTEAPVETTEAPEETTAAPEETTSPEVPSTGDSAIFFIVALIAFSAIFAFAVALGKKRTEN